jgi:hypothetical protein
MRGGNLNTIPNIKAGGQTAETRPWGDEASREGVCYYVKVHGRTVMKGIEFNRPGHGLNIDCSLNPPNEEAVVEPVNEISALDIVLEHQVFLGSGSEPTRQV